MTETTHTTGATLDLASDRVERRLRELLERSERQLVELEQNLSGLLRERGTLQEDKDNTRLVVDAIRADVWHTKRALTRLTDGTYGRCIRCHQPIAPERLEALPIVERCASCA